MPPQEPLKPGEVRISFPQAATRPSASPLQQYPVYRHRQHSGSVLGPLVCALVLWLIGAIGGSTGGGGGGYSSYGGGSQTPVGYTMVGSTADSSSGPVFRLPKKPILEGRYAAFIRRQDHRNRDALVVAYDRIEIRVVSSPPDDATDAIAYPAVTPPDYSALFRDFKNNGKLSFPNGKFPDGKLFDFDHLGPNQEVDILSRNHDLLFPDFPSPLLPRQGTSVLQPKKEHRLSPYVVHGDVIIECGPLVSRDQMVAHLVMQHGGLKAASITVINGAPRGPPTKDEFANRPVRTIYIVGKVLQVSGPTQRDRSVLQASVVDLGPSEKQLDKYIAASVAWHDNVLEVVGSNYSITDEMLWSERAESGLVLRPAPHPEYNPYRPGGEYYHPPVEHYESRPFEGVP